MALLGNQGIHYYIITNREMYWYVYSPTCIKRSPLGQRKSGLIRQVTS